MVKESSRRSGKGVGLPTRFVRVGDVFSRYGKVLRCVERPAAGVMMPSDACMGCFFSCSRSVNSMINCNDIQCSKFDRMDGRSVWFVEEND